jgi:hypothetical protein
MGSIPSRHTKRKARRDESLADISSSRTAANSIRTKLESSRFEAKCADASTKAAATPRAEAETPRDESLIDTLAAEVAGNSIRVRDDTSNKKVWIANTSTKRAPFTVDPKLKTLGNQHLSDMSMNTTATSTVYTSNGSDKRSRGITFATSTVYSPSPFNQLPSGITASRQSQSFAQFGTDVGALTTSSPAVPIPIVLRTESASSTDFASTSRVFEQVRDAIRRLDEERRKRDGEPDTYEERLAWKKEWNTVWYYWVWLENEWDEANKAEGIEDTPAEQWWKNICARDD